MDYGAIGDVSRVSRIVLGTSHLGAAAPDDAIALLDAAFAAGVNAFDTAPMYLDGASQRALGAWMRTRGVRRDVVVVDKGGHPRDGGGPRFLTWDVIRQDVDRSRELLQVDALDLFLLHRDDPDVPVDEVMGWLDALVREGAVRAVGASNWTARRLREANAYAETHGRTTLAASSPQLSLAVPTRAPWRGCISLGGAQGAADRRWHRESRLPVLAWSPLADGFLAAAPVDAVGALPASVSEAARATFGTADNLARLRRAHELARARGVSVVRIALAYLFRQGLDLFAIVRTSRPAAIADAAGALAVDLSAAEVAWLDDGLDDDARAQRNVPPAILSRRIYDAIVVGAGPAGAWAAKELTEGGMSVLLLDAGPERDLLETDTNDARAIAARVALRGRQPVQSRHLRHEEVPPTLFADDVLSPYAVDPGHPFWWFRGHQIGGRSLLWAGVTPRFSNFEFHAADLDGVGENWPLSYEELVPCYDHVERFLRIAGSHEGIPSLPDGQYTSALGLTAAEVFAKGAFEARWPDRKLIPIRGVPPERVDENRWWYGTTIPLVAAARATGRLHTRPGTLVRQIVWDNARGEAKGVACIDRETRAEFEAFGRIVFLCASTIESTRILLDSSSSAFPDGLGNGSDCLGRYLIDKPFLCLRGNMRGHFDPPGHGHPTLRAERVFLPRFVNLGPRSGLSFLRGYGFSGGFGHWIEDAGSPFWLLVHGEMLPHADNRVTLRRDQRDAWGIPIAHVRCTYGENEREMVVHMTSTLHELADAADLSYRWPPGELVDPGSYVHEIGSARMGSDPRKSVLDPYNRVWEAPNVYVTDGACFPSGGWQNPTLTIMALTVRACRHVLAHAMRGETP